MSANVQFRTLYGTAVGEPTPVGLCQCSCDRRTNVPTIGAHRGQPMRFVHGHNGRKASYRVNSESGCWEWTGQTNWNGYGLASVDDKTQSAHRLVYERERGPIPDGLHLDHLCNNRRCVNPDHLEPVTPKENVRRSFERGNR